VSFDEFLKSALREAAQRHNPLSTFLGRAHARRLPEVVQGSSSCCPANRTRSPHRGTTRPCRGRVRIRLADVGQSGPWDLARGGFCTRRDQLSPGCGSRLQPGRVRVRSRVRCALARRRLVNSCTQSFHTSAGAYPCFDGLLELRGGFLMLALTAEHTSLMHGAERLRYRAE